ITSLEASRIRSDATVRSGQTFYGHVANRPPTWNDSSPWFMYTTVSGYGLMKQFTMVYVHDCFGVWTNETVK
ncbi:hypothetical protein Tco_0034981, partial [Tanacetum coccineum]